ncbi:transport-associated protein [Sesbania bispinosa]|nr:transport-associated protein [Sesbania bispinosa]
MEGGSHGGWMKAANLAAGTVVATVTAAMALPLQGVTSSTTVAGKDKDREGARPAGGGGALKVVAFRDGGDNEQWLMVTQRLDGGQVGPQSGGGIATILAASGGHSPLSLTLLNNKGGQGQKGGGSRRWPRLAGRV